MFGGNIHYTPAPQKEFLVESIEFISLRNFSVEIEHMTAFDTPYKPPIAAKRISISLPSSLAIIIKYVIFCYLSLSLFLLCKTADLLLAIYVATLWCADERDSQSENVFLDVTVGTK